MSRQIIRGVVYPWVYYPYSLGLINIHFFIGFDLLVIFSFTRRKNLRVNYKKAKNLIKIRKTKK